MNSLVIQWLGLCVFTLKGRGSAPGWGTKIPQEASGCAPHPQKPYIQNAYTFSFQQFKSQI